MIESIAAGTDPCSEISLPLTECYAGAGGPYTVYYTLNGVPDSILNVSINSSNEIDLTGLATGAYTNLYVTDSKSCPSNSFSINLQGGACTELCDNGFDVTICAYNIDVTWTYNWNFGANASPSTATGPGPHNIRYSATANTQVQLIVSKGSCSETETEGVEIIACSVEPPIAWHYKCEADTCVEIVGIGIKGNVPDN